MLLPLCSYYLPILPCRFASSQEIQSEAPNWTVFTTSILIRCKWYDDGSHDGRRSRTAKINQ
jgi:hypothetical protein